MRKINIRSVCRLEAIVFSTAVVMWVHIKFTSMLRILRTLYNRKETSEQVFLETQYRFSLCLF